MSTQIPHITTSSSSCCYSRDKPDVKLMLVACYSGCPPWLPPAVANLCSCVTKLAWNESLVHEEMPLW